MKLLRALLGLTAFSSLVPAANAATFDFIETGITCDTGSCSLPAPAFRTLATLILPDPISTGTAVWDGTSAPAYTGNAFALTVLLPAFSTSPHPSRAVLIATIALRRSATSTFLGPPATAP